MKMGIIVISLVLMLVGQFTAVSGQENCWDRIGECVGSVEAGGLSECCPVLIQEVTDNRRCFCTIVPVIEGNVTLEETFTSFLRICDITSSFDTICPDVEAPPLTPTRPPPSDMSFRTPPITGTTPESHIEVPDSINSPPLPDSESSSSKGNNLHIIIPAIVVPLVIVIMVASIIVFCIRYRKHKKKIKIVSGNESSGGNYKPSSNETPLNAPPPPPPPPQQEMPTEYPTLDPRTDFATIASLQFEKNTLQAATNNFAPANELGRGGFGVVYKGILGDGQEIAIKRLLNITSQGDREFESEAFLLAKLRHKNLVTLVGFCITNTEKLLVYEFMPNKSLDHFLFDSRMKYALDWTRRYNIIKGIARGMNYLHEESPTRIIHRDLKAANVLLDTELNPKVADFGLARVCAFEETHVETSKIAGTQGYMAPEYFSYGQYSVKSDVFSFGILILEIMSGRKAREPSVTASGGSSILLEYAWTCWLNREPLELVDPSMGGSYSRNEAIRCIHLGLLCVQEEINKRPTMETIAHKLNTYSVASETLTMPQPPSFLSKDSSRQRTVINNDDSAPWPQDSTSGAVNHIGQQRTHQPPLYYGP